MEENCTVHFTSGTVRAHICRAIAQNNYSWIAVKFPPEAFRYFTNVDPFDGWFESIVPTYVVEPDKCIKSVNWYYYIGDSRDACPIAVDNFDWYIEKPE